jgi:hypothetical protein
MRESSQVAEIAELLLGLNAKIEMTPVIECRRSTQGADRSAGNHPALRLSVVGSRARGRPSSWRRRNRHEALQCSCPRPSEDLRGRQWPVIGTVTAARSDTAAAGKSVSGWTCRNRCSGARRCSAQHRRERGRGGRVRWVRRRYRNDLCADPDGCGQSAGEGESDEQKAVLGRRACCQRWRQSSCSFSHCQLPPHWARRSDVSRRADFPGLALLNITDMPFIETAGRWKPVNPSKAR